MTRREWIQMGMSSSLLLASGRFSSRCWDLFALAPSATPLNGFFEQAVQANALKTLYAQTGHAPYLHGFKTLRAQILTE